MYEHLQVTFAQNETLEVQSSPSRIIKLFGVTYHLSSQGLPQFGQVFAPSFLSLLVLNYNSVEKTSTTESLTSHKFGKV